MDEEKQVPFMTFLLRASWNMATTMSEIGKYVSALESRCSEAEKTIKELKDKVSGLSVKEEV